LLYEPVENVFDSIPSIHVKLRRLCLFCFRRRLVCLVRPSQTEEQGYQIQNSATAWTKGGGGGGGLGGGGGGLGGGGGGNGALTS
jgi:cell division protein FtsW (lipid II flippase)